MQILRPSGKSFITEAMYVLVFDLPTNKEDYKQRYIAGNIKCYIKPLSKLLTSILSEVETGLQGYCDTSY